MSKIYEMLGLNKPAFDGTFGVEIECEGNRLSPVDSAYWRTESDGSLRGAFPNNSCEYVMKKPLRYKAAMLAIKHLLNEQREDVEFHFSFRTSVHVHVNVQDLEWEEYLAMCYAWMLIEHPMMDYCGEARKANRFCLRVEDCEGVVDVMLRFINEQSFRNINPNDVRYAALNMAATDKYGSLEFRGMRGTVDEAVLSNWLMALGSLKEYARGKTMLDVYKHYQDTDNKTFLTEVVGSDIFWNNSDKGMDTSFSLTIQLPFAKEFV